MLCKTLISYPYYKAVETLRLFLTDDVPLPIKLYRLSVIYSAELLPETKPVTQRKFNDAATRSPTKEEIYFNCFPSMINTLAR